MDLTCVPFLCRHQNQDLEVVTQSPSRLFNKSTFAPKYGFLEWGCFSAGVIQYMTSLFSRAHIDIFSSEGGPAIQIPLPFSHLSSQDLRCARSKTSQPNEPRPPKWPKNLIDRSLLDHSLEVRGQPILSPACEDPNRTLLLAEN